MTRLSVKIGAASFAIGLSLALPQSAVADTQDNAETSGPSTPHVSRTAAAPSRKPAAAQPARGARTARAGVPSAAAAGRPPGAGGSGAAAPSAAPIPAATPRPIREPVARRLGAPTAATWSPPAATAALPVPSAVTAGQSAVNPMTPAAAVPAAQAVRPAPAAPADRVAGAIIRFAQLLDSATTTSPGLPANPVGDLIAGALVLLRRTLLPGLPTVPVATVGNARVPEGGPEDPQSAVFTVSLKSAYTTTVMVHYETTSGTATAGTDFTPVSGELVFAPGETTANVSVGIVPDSVYEGDETFGLTLTPASGPARLRAAVLAAGTATISDIFTTAAPALTFPELDSPTSKLAVRVDPTQQSADGIKVDAGTKFTLTLPSSATDYTVLANKPDLVDIASAGNQLTVTAKTPGFLGLSVKSQDGTAARYLGLYIADPNTHIVPDSVTEYLPVGSITAPDATGDTFLENFNFRPGVAPIDYLYIYDQGGADSTDGNLRGLLTQAVRHGLVPVVVFYNIQAVDNAAGKTGITEGPDSAFQSINDYNWSGSNQKDPNMFTGYMNRYFTKLATDFTAMNNVGVPVQVVMEPDFLGYMAANTPGFTPPTPFVPNPGDRTLNTAKVSAMYDAGLLTRGKDPDFPDTVAGLVQAINYYTAAKTQNLRIGWKTNIWAVAPADFTNQKMGLLHQTDSMVYPWQNQWTAGAGWDQGRIDITKGATNLGNFLNKVGVTSWTGSPDRKPFLAIDKYGVDGAFLYDQGTATAARGILSDFVSAAQYYCATKCDPAATAKYFGLDPAGLLSLKVGFDTQGNPYDPRFPAVLTALQNAAIADPNIALWFVNADQWNNYLLLVKTLSTTLNGTKVMLWQIPQGHINGSTDLPNTDLTNTVANFEDSATSYFFGDTFTATDGRAAHFGANQAADPGVTVSGNTVTWGQHMTMAEDSGVLSVLFGAGLGISTRGSVTPAGGANDLNFWADKATAYLSAVNP